MFSGDKKEVNHLRIFGFPIYVHVPKDKRTKLDPSGKKDTFVGYSDTSKAYKVCIPNHRKIDISRDVTVDEDACFHKSKHDCEEESHDKENGVPRATKKRKWKQRNPFLWIGIWPNHIGLWRITHKREDHIGHKRPSEM
jgi:hypothetical protein